MRNLRRYAPAVAGMRWNRWPEWTGLRGRNRSEWVAEITGIRNNSARDAVNGKIGRYNRMVEANNASGLVTHTNVSIGGGIQLSLRNAKIVRRAPHAPQVKAIAAARPHFVDSGNVQAGGGWVRSRP